MRDRAGGWTMRAFVWFGLGCAMALPCTAEAQRASDPAIRVLVGPGLALAGGTGLESGIGGLAHVVVERARHRFVLRFSVIADVAGFPDGAGDGDVSETGLLYGRRSGGAGPGRSLSVGVAVVHFQRSPDVPLGWMP